MHNEQTITSIISSFYFSTEIPSELVKVIKNYQRKSQVGIQGYFFPQMMYSLYALPKCYLNVHVLT